MEQGHPAATAQVIKNFNDDDDISFPAADGIRCALRLPPDDGAKHLA